MFSFRNQPSNLEYIQFFLRDSVFNDLGVSQGHRHFDMLFGSVNQILAKIYKYASVHFVFKIYTVHSV